MTLKETLNAKRIHIIRAVTLLLLGAAWIFLSSVELDGSIPNSDVLFKTFTLDYFQREHETAVHEPVVVVKNNGARYTDLGRATWKLFHLTLERFPDVNMNEKSDLKKREKLIAWVELLGETYPCSTSNSDNDSNIFLEAVRANPLPINLNKVVSIEWGCHIHNAVNTRLGKAKYDCLHLAQDVRPSNSDFNQDIEVEDLDKVTLNKEEKQLG
ncbi:hypothetical protein DAKH74_021050 [Maudiozyma humilis]|uniref:Sulfhydryl oxidase n=1 Tax=Maudiozyma humilis TaxID=51915 RepID=A0AAV5RY88_MAUHU|nr:hypothetical protein DAKH74_021050 [Kazachstania humilis]